MDLMDVRREMMGVIAGMASGVDYVKGSFTVPNDAHGPFTINFGKSFSKYLYCIEMDDLSKSALMSCGATGDRVYACVGQYPASVINNSNPSNCNVMAYKVKPASGEIKTPSVTESYIDNIGESFFAADAADFTSGTYYFYKGCTYNYYIFEIN